MLFDSHFHPQLIPTDQHDDLFAKAKSVGVIQYLGVSLNIDDAVGLDLISQNMPGMHYSIGLHPCEVNADNCDKIQECNLMHAVALGETGLDYYKGKVSDNQKELQKRSFRNHLDRSVSTGLPVIVHTREAEEDTLAILREYEGIAYGILHCFTGSTAMALAAVDLGWYISFSGIITMKRGEHLHQTVLSIPQDRILIETDSPYLTPTKYSGKPNMPAYILETAAMLYTLCKITPEILTANTLRCLKIK
jgi:TatD DNase family protein